MAKIIVEGLDQLRAKFQQYPVEYYRAVRVTMQAALLKLWENVPPYPPKPPESNYRRTGQLGRSLGSGPGGGKSGATPSIYEVKQGPKFIEASFGTNLKYAPHVIGDRQTQQARHMRHWWTLPQDVFNAAKEPIIRLFGQMAGRMAAWIAGRK